MKNILLLFIVLSLVACRESVDSEPDISRMFPVENRSFVLYFPTNDWKLVNQQGTDSYVGYFEKGNDKISFDYGWYNVIVHKDKNPNLISYQETTINGKSAVIAKEKTNKGFVISAIIRKGEEDRYTSTKLYCENPANEQEIIRVFRTHRFK